MVRYFALLSVDSYLLTSIFRDLGDSLGDRDPSTDVQYVRRGLENWLGVAFGVPFKDLGNAFPIGRQEDGSSCGICVVNAIEHAMFGAPLFMNKDRKALRVRYFVAAVTHLLENVSILLCTDNRCAYLFFSFLGLRTKGMSNQTSCRIWGPMRRRLQTREKTNHRFLL